jgi:hypothetical protein
LSTAWEKWKSSIKDIVVNNINSEVSPLDLINPNVPRAPIEISEKRMSVCSSCPELIKSTSQCKKCGCFMAAKTKLANAKCPLGHWEKYDSASS